MFRSHNVIEKITSIHRNFKYTISTFILCTFSPQTFGNESIIIQFQKNFEELMPEKG